MWHNLHYFHFIKIRTNKSPLSSPYLTGGYKFGSATPLRRGTNDIKPHEYSQGNPILPAFFRQQMLEAEFHHHIMGTANQ
jgi:hypothetical protein